MKLELLYSRAQKWAERMKDPLSLIEAPEFRAVKREGRTLAGFATADGEPVFIKRFDSSPWIRGIFERLRKSRAARSLAGQAILTEKKFLVPRSLAAAEERSAGAVRCSWLLSEALLGAQTFSAFLARAKNGVRDERWRWRVLTSVASEVRRMHDAGVFGSDLQETNLMVEEKDGKFLVYFVDLDRFREMRTVSNRLRYRNLVQLDRSIGRFTSRAERLRFLMAYLRQHPGKKELRAMIKDLMAERWRKENEYQRRRARPQAVQAGARATEH